jgi:acetyltransferase-like isoleucine patch superfamily enzyme
MIGALVSRLAYLRFLFRRGAWMWVIRRIDYLVTDHVLPWSELHQPEHCNIHPTVTFRHGRNIVLGSHTRIQPYAVLWASPRSKITLGRNSGLGPGTMIFSSNHQYVPGMPYHKQPWTEKDVTIGEDVWVGAGTVIVAGVTIGDRCVVAAGSVVTKDIPPDSVAAGVPAKVIKSRG